jgi:hypothetical protein
LGWWQGRPNVSLVQAAVVALARTPAVVGLHNSVGRSPKPKKNWALEWPKQARQRCDVQYGNSTALSVQPSI